MIKSFSCKNTQALFEGQRVKAFANIADSAVRKLRMLSDATDVDDLKALPGNRFEELKGDRRGQCSIRINQQFRLCFRFENGDAFEVAICDYH